MNLNEIHRKLPFFGFEEHLMVYNDGSLGAGFKLTGIDISCAPDEMINTLCERVESLLVGLKEDLRVQLFYSLNGNVAKILEEHKSVSEKSVALYQPIREAHFDFLTSKQKKKLFFIPEIYLFIRSESLQLRKRGLLEKREEFRLYPQKEFKTLREQFEVVVSQLEASLSAAGLSPKRLSDEEWFSLCFSYLNHKRSEAVGAPSLRDVNKALAPSLSSQLALTDIRVTEKHLSIDERLFRVVTLAILPEGETFASMVEALTKLPFHFWISQNIRTLDQTKEISKLELKRRIANSMATGSQNVSDIESESKLSDLEDLLRELMAGSEKLISADLNVIFWGDTKEELERKTEEVLRAFRSMNQAEGLVETFALEDVFFRVAPSVCEGFRLKKMKSSNCTHLMPLYGSWLGNERPVVLLSNRDGGPFSIDPFAQNLPNWNGLIFGGSGAGKSFTISSLMLQFCAQEPRPQIVWIDNGASSQKLIEVLNGEFIDLNLNSGLRINMFDLEDDKATGPSPTRVKLILGCLELILKDEEKPGLPKREKALLEEAIFTCYKQSGHILPTLSTLRTILAEHPVPEMRKYAEILFSWTGETAYGQMLDGASNVKLNKDLVSIEIKGLDNHKELKDIFLLLFTSFIKDEAAKDLARPYLLIIDEAHRLFITPSGKDFAIECYRVFRKYNAGIFCISQNYRDFLSDPGLADALLPNTTSVFILRQRKIDWEDFKSTFDFNDAQIAAIKSLEIVKGKFSEFFFMQDENQAVVRLEPEPLSYWICTTDGNDKAKIEEARAHSPETPLIEILRNLAKEGIS